MFIILHNTHFWDYKSTKTLLYHKTIIYKIMYILVISSNFALPKHGSKPQQSQSRGEKRCAKENNKRNEQTV